MCLLPLAEPETLQKSNSCSRSLNWRDLFYAAVLRWPIVQRNTISASRYCVHSVVQTDSRRLHW